MIRWALQNNQPARDSGCSVAVSSAETSITSGQWYFGYLQGAE